MNVCYSIHNYVQINLNNLFGLNDKFRRYIPVCIKNTNLFVMSRKEQKSKKESITITFKTVLVLTNHVYNLILLLKDNSATNSLIFMDIKILGKLNLTLYLEVTITFYY